MSLWDIVLCAFFAALMAGTLAWGWSFMSRMARESPILPLDSYYYRDLAQQIRAGRGPAVEWPQGPKNMYFPGFAGWWSLFAGGSQDPEDSLRDFPHVQLSILLGLMAALVALGRVAWSDWPGALGFASLVSASSLILKWASVPLSEVMAALCVAALLAAGLRLDNFSAGGGRHGRLTPLAALAVFAAIGIATRIEVAFVVIALAGALVWRRRLRAWEAALVLAVAALPVAVWQFWLLETTGRPTIYTTFGVKRFQPKEWVASFLFQILFFVNIPNVAEMSAPSNAALGMFFFVFVAAMLVSLRGYLNRACVFSAWTLLGYWMLHVFWYYQTERYNVIVIPLGYLFFFEGAGRLVNWRHGWKSKAGRIVLPLMLLAVIPAFWFHAQDNVNAMRAAFAADALNLDRETITKTMRHEGERVANPVIVTNLPIDLVHRFPGQLWFDYTSHVDFNPFVEPGRFPSFAREQGVTHLVLREPAQEWLDRNGDQGLVFQPIIADGQVWIARVIPRE